MAEHLKAFAEDARSAGRRRNTIVKYEQGLLKLCKRCRWVTLRDVTEESFIAWRKKSGLSPKTVNDDLSIMRIFFPRTGRNRLIPCGRS